MLTINQQNIIREVCSLEFRSLERILVKTELGLIAPFLTFEDYLQENGLSRKDFDEELISIYNKFKKIYIDPQQVFFILTPNERKIFRMILIIFEENWINHLFDDFKGISELDYRIQDMNISQIQIN